MEFIEFLSPNALAKLKQANDMIITMVGNVEKVGKAMRSMNAPSAVDGGAKQRIADLKAQEAAIKQATNALIQEEKVKQASIATQIRLNAQKKSDLSLANAKEASTRREVLATEKLNSAYQQLSARRKQAADALQTIIIRGQQAGQSQKQYNQGISDTQVNKLVNAFEKNRSSLTIKKDKRGEQIFQEKNGQRRQLVNSIISVKGYDI